MQTNKNLLKNTRYYFHCLEIYYNTQEIVMSNFQINKLVN